MVLALTTCTASAQDLSWLVEQSPLISIILVKALDKTPSFSAKVDLQVAAAGEPVPSSASGTIEFQDHNLRWEAKLSDVSSAQLTSNTRALVKQINGDRFLLLTRPDLQANYLVLGGAHACLESRLPNSGLLPKSIHVGQETNMGRLCSKERIKIPLSDGTTNDVLIWRAKEFKNMPVRIQVSNASEVFSIQLREPQFRTIRSERFKVPEDLPKYNSVEDLVQSLVLERMKRKMGLE